MTYTGAFTGEAINVDAMVKDPTYIQQHITEDLTGAFLEEAIFRNGGTNDGVVAFREAATPFLEDKAETVAEYAEIPVSHLSDGKVRSIIGHKTALGIEVSYEMRRFNRIDRVNQQVTALKNTMVRSSVDAALAAFAGAKVPTLNVTDKWDSAKGNPLGTFRAAKRMISQARPENRPDTLFGYNPDTLLIATSAFDAALEHEATQKLFNGNAALENPLYKGTLPATLAGLRVVTSAWLKEDEMYVLEAGTAGFFSDSIPMTVSELYCPSGDVAHGGTNMSWRVDAFRQRIFAVDNPKAVVKIEGMFS